MAYRGGRLQGHRKEATSGQIARPHGLHYHHLHVLPQHSSGLVHWQHGPPPRIRGQPDIRTLLYQSATDIREEDYVDKAADHVEKENEAHRNRYVCLCVNSTQQSSYLTRINRGIKHLRSNLSNLRDDENSKLNYNNFIIKNYSHLPEISRTCRSTLAS